MARPIMGQPKIVCWDIEATHLRADFGTMLCVGIKEFGKTPEVHRINDWGFRYKNALDDRDLTAHVVEELGKADLWVTYYGKGFDVPFVNAKCLEHKLPFLAPIPHVDLYFTARHNLAISRRSLEKVGLFAGLTTQKTPVDGPTWKRAAIGDKAAIKAVASHCKADVELLEEAYVALRGLVRLHPRVRDGEGCHVCHKEGTLTRRGYYYTKSGKKQRVQCVSCGSWGKL